MPYCSSCGSDIPDGQGHSCSMCYGDPYWGRDGYYLRLLEEQELEEMQKREWERQEMAMEQESNENDKDEKKDVANS